MTISIERQAQLREVLDEIVKTDPNLAGLDPSNENDAKAIEDVAQIHNAVANHQPIDYVIEQLDGTEQLVILQPIGRVPNGKPVYRLLYERPPGGLSELSKATIRALMTPDPDEDLRLMLVLF